MPAPEPARLDARLQRLRGFRVRPPRDHALTFLRPLFQKHTAKPFKQLAGFVDAWERLVPPALLPFTRLDALQRGTLSVSVADSAKLFQLDGHLRAGLQRQLADAVPAANLRRVKLIVDGNVGLIAPEGE
jgi:hypothetical protein